MPRTIQFLRPWIYTLLVAHMLIFLHTIIQQLALTPMVFRLVDLVFLIIMLGSQFVVFAMFYTPLAVISWWMKTRFFRSLGWKSEAQQLGYAATCLLLILLMQGLVLEIQLLANTSFYGLSVAVYHLFAMLLVQLLSWLNLRSRLKIQLLRKRARLDLA
jgi:hypothetical protein